MINNGRARLNWVNTAMSLAFDIAEYRSQDFNTQVGACVLKNDDDIVLGYNGGPAGIEIDWSNREEKRKRVIHAESNVLSRIKAGEVKVFCVTHLPCLECLKIIAQKKIKKVYYCKVLDNYNPGDVFGIAAEFGIELIQIEQLNDQKVKENYQFKYLSLDERVIGGPAWTENN